MRRELYQVGGDPVGKAAPMDRLMEDARTGARMLQPDDKLTPATRDEVLARLRHYFTEHSIPYSRIALRLDTSEPVISQVLSGSYKADPAKWIRGMCAFVDEMKDKKSAPVKGRRFVQTGVAKRIFAVAKYVMKYNGIGLAYGPAGIGKTMTLKALASEIPASIYLSLRTGCETPLAVIEAIGRAAGIAAGRPSVRAWSDRLQELLHGSGRIILIDEIHKVVGTRNDAALHMLRDLHDQTECPMVWVGTSEIIAHIQTGQARGREPLDQLSSRIGPFCDLAEGTTMRGGGRRLVSSDDIRRVCAQDGMRISEDAVQYLTKMANLKGAGAYRAVTKLLELAATTARGDIITAAILDAALPLRSGTEAAARRRREINQLEDEPLAQTA